MELSGYYSECEIKDGKLIKNVFSKPSFFKSIQDAVFSESFYLKKFKELLESKRFDKVKIPSFYSFTEKTITMEMASGKKYSASELRKIVPDTVFQQTLEFLDFCNKEGFYHNDISEENILYDEEKQEMWIIDFGKSGKEIHDEISDVESLRLIFRK